MTASVNSISSKYWVGVEVICPIRLRMCIGNVAFFLKPTETEYERCNAILDRDLARYLIEMIDSK